MNRLALQRSIYVCSTLSVAYTLLKYNRLKAKCNEKELPANELPIIVIDKDVVSNDLRSKSSEYWKEKAEACSFCRLFLKSPCSETFKEWSICVDHVIMKEGDRVNSCSEYTMTMLSCVENSKDYFTAAHDAVKSSSPDVDAENTDNH